MKRFGRATRAVTLCALCGVHVVAGGVQAAEPVEAGQVKVVRGAAFVQRGGQQIAGAAGMKVYPADVLVTGADGAVGVTFRDGSLVSTGPNSVFAIDQYRFDGTTHAGAFEGSLRKGTLAGISGKMVKNAPESMRIKTPASIMGVRGTEFLVQVEVPVTVTGK